MSDFDFSADEMNEWGESKEVTKGGPGRPAPGNYHAQVDDVRVDDDVIELQCVVVSPGSELGKRFPVKLYKHGGNRKDKNGDPIDESPEEASERRKRAVRTAINLGMITEAEYDRRLAARQGISLNFAEQAPTCQFIAHVVPNKFKNDQGQEVNTTRAFINSINDPRAKKNVKSWDQTLLAMLEANPFGGDGPNANAGSSEMAGAGAGNGSPSASKYDDI